MLECYSKYWKCNKCGKFIESKFWYLIDCSHKLCQVCKEKVFKECTICKTKIKEKFIEVNLKKDDKEDSDSDSEKSSEKNEKEKSKSGSESDSKSSSDEKNKK